jgi:hypothetical protein
MRAGQLKKRKKNEYGAWTLPHNKYNHYYQSVKTMIVKGEVKFHEQWATCNEHRTRAETFDTFMDHIGRQRIYRSERSGQLTISGKRNEAGVLVANQNDDGYIALSFSLYWNFGFEQLGKRRQLYPTVGDYNSPRLPESFYGASMTNVSNPFL